MSKTYVFKFGSGDPRTYVGLSPTFVIFTSGPTNLTPPGISLFGVSTGFYQFSYAATYPIAFTIDGGNTISSAVDRYVSNSLDPIQAVDQKVGYSTDSFGSTSADPSTLFGFAKRVQELQEGDASYNKTTLVWSIYSRGSSTLLREKTLTNTSSTATKT